MPQTKPKKSTKISKPRVKPKAITQTKKPPTRNMSIPKSIMTHVCALNDPFCAHAEQGRYGDSGRVKSLPLTMHYSHTVTTDASGNGACLILPQFLNSSPLEIPSSNVNTNDFSTAAVAFYPWPGMTYTPTQVRLVTFGVTIRGISAPMYRSGLVKVRVFGHNTGAALGIVNTRDYLCDEYADVPLSDCREIAVKSRRISDIATHWQLPDHYLASGGAATTWVSPGFQSIAVHIVGGPASVGVLTIEVLEHWELVLGDNDPMQRLAQQPLPTSNVMKEAAETVSNASKSIFTGGVKMATAYIAKAAKNAIAGYLGGPMAVAGMNAIMID